MDVAHSVFSTASCAAANHEAEQTAVERESSELASPVEHLDQPADTYAITDKRQSKPQQTNHAFERYTRLNQSVSRIATIPRLVQAIATAFCRMR